MTGTDRATEITLLGLPVEAGAGRRGCVMGPTALRIVGLAEALDGLGHRVRDSGDLAPPAAAAGDRAAEVAAWVQAIDAAAGDLPGCPVFLGGDHSLSAGTINAMSRRAAAQGQPLHVLWLDAHADFNTPATSPSGNLHGMPVAALTGAPELAFLYGDRPRAVLAPEAFHMFGLRSVDAEERRLLRLRGVDVADMRQIDEHGTARLVAAMLERVARAGARLHVSLDVDFLDPAIAPAVGTTVPGGATAREAHLVMEMLADSGLVGSVDLVELNPFLDHAGRTAQMMVELVASLFGRRILPA